MNDSTHKQVFNSLNKYVEEGIPLDVEEGIPLVAILLCTFNGESFLAEQLDSLETQTYKNWIVIASDDGSTDLTLQILKQYQVKWPSGKLTIRRGPQKGFCLNFLNLACDPKIKADFFAFCDQDDVWLPEKLMASIQIILAKQKEDQPFLYCGRTKYVTVDLKPCGESPKFVFPPSFRNALVQSIAGGNTMVFNHAAKCLVEKPGPLNLPSHDWWVYILVSGHGGAIYYDSTSLILYRQHTKALVGGNTTLKARCLRCVMFLKGRLQNWNNQHCKSLVNNSYILSDENKYILDWFTKLKFVTWYERIRILGVCGLYRQTRVGTFSLYVAAFLNKL